MANSVSITSSIGSNVSYKIEVDYDRYTMQEMSISNHERKYIITEKRPGTSGTASGDITRSLAGYTHMTLDPNKKHKQLSIHVTFDPLQGATERKKTGPVQTNQDTGGGNGYD